MLTTDGDVGCWGRNQDGELGLGNTDNFGDESDETMSDLPFLVFPSGVDVVAVSPGHFHTCILSAVGDVYCFGNNVHGATGSGVNSIVGDDESLTDLAPVALPGNAKASTIACSELQTCAVMVDNQLICWGNGQYGSHGQGNTQSLGNTPSTVPSALPPIKLPGGETVKSISPGAGGFCVILGNDRGFCFGRGEMGAMGQGNLNNVGTQGGTMSNFSPIQFSNPAATVQAIDIGMGHACAMLDNGEITCWGGHAQYGAIGGTCSPDFNPTPSILDPLEFPEGETVVDFSVGNWHTCFAFESGGISCIGRNRYGQLGMGDTLDRGCEGGETLATLDPIGVPSTDIDIETVVVNAGDALTNGQTVIEVAGTATDLGRVSLGQDDLAAALVISAQDSLVVSGISFTGDNVFTTAGETTTDSTHTTAIVLADDVGAGTFTATVTIEGNFADFSFDIQVIVTPCGNSRTTPDDGEQCDDGNLADGDGCSSTCQFEACGDGAVDMAAGEFCDDGNVGNNDGCTACKPDDGMLCSGAPSDCVPFCEAGYVVEDDVTFQSIVASSGVRLTGTTDVTASCSKNGLLAYADQQLHLCIGGSWLALASESA